MLTHEEILDWLRCDEPAALRELWSLANTVRHCCVGDEVHLRGLVEISNCCVRQCDYCGLRAANTKISRYRMAREEILECAQDAVRLRYGTLVMQAGEDPGIEVEWMEDLIREIKATTPLAVTLSLGEREDGELERWKHAGADRYLLRFETSDRMLYEMIHPPSNGRISDRIAMLKRLREIGYEIGSGIMVGIPGQTYQSLADDLRTFADLDLDMVGIGPFIAHPDTPLGARSGASRISGPAASLPPARKHEQAPSARQRSIDNPSPGASGPPQGRGRATDGRPSNLHTQVPNSELMVYKVVALTRIMCPQANLPATTALATINKATGRENGLQRGANVVMPNLTPVKYRALYQIYPGKSCIDETARQCNQCIKGRIRSIGRMVGAGPGGRRRRD